MAEFIKKHPVKIQMTISLAAIISVLYFGAQVSAFVNTAEINFQRLDEVEEKANMMPILETNIKTLQTDLTEVKGDIKYLIKLNK